MRVLLRSKYRPQVPDRNSIMLYSAAVEPAMGRIAAEIDDLGLTHRFSRVDTTRTPALAEIVERLRALAQSSAGSEIDLYVSLCAWDDDAAGNARCLVPRFDRRCVLVHLVCGSSREIGVDDVDVGVEHGDVVVHTSDMTCASRVVGPTDSIHLVLVVTQPQSATRMECRNFARHGSCVYGSGCRFEHSAMRAAKK